MTVARRLLMQEGGSLTGTRTLPTLTLTREATNPVIDVDGNPSETTEQYIPAPVLVNGTTWVYVKGALDVYAWSASDGVTFTLTSTPVIARGGGGAWDAGAVVQPVAVYDEATDTIHIWYGGAASGITSWGWGHATAPGSDPTNVTKDAGNPIFSNASAVTALGGTVNDFKLCDVVVIEGTFYFYGYAQVGSRYKMVYSTGTTFDDPSGLTVIATAPNDASVIIEPTVFLVPGIGAPLYGMIYTRGGLSQSPPTERSIRLASSTDGETWDFSSTTDLLGPTAGGWEDWQVYGSSLLKSTVVPYLRPLPDSLGRWRLYYSGFDGTDANAGLAYVARS